MIKEKEIIKSGKLIQIRPYAKFVPNEEDKAHKNHRNHYVEVIYTCRGMTHHVINGTDIFLEQGELLFLDQNAEREDYEAGQMDLAVGFIIRPEFFDYALQIMGEEENMLRSFVIDCLKGNKKTTGFMYFKVADVVPIQNLVENLIWTLSNKVPNKRSINQITMGLLFLQLMNYMDRMQTDIKNHKQDLIFTVLHYIEENYRNAELSELADSLHYDVYWMSKEIKRRTGRTYTELLQTKRLNQAAYLLDNTRMSVLEIGMAVGYDNISYFHKIFYKKFGVTPRNYRMQQNLQ